MYFPFRCCAHVSELEHTYFSAGASANQKGLSNVKSESHAVEHTSEFDEELVPSFIIILVSVCTSNMHLIVIIHPVSLRISM